MISTSPSTDSAAREALIFNRLQAWDKAILSRTEIGIMIREVRDGLLWKHRDGCTSFTSWVRSAAPRAYSTAHQYLREVTELSDIPDAHLSQIRGENVDTVMQLSTAVRNDPEVLVQAQTQPNEEFVESIRQNHPEQALEHRRALRFVAEESAAKKIEEALDRALDHGASNRNDALELLAVTAMETWQIESEVERAVEEASA